VIGSLAGGVAHDFNNLLSVILSYTAFAKNGLCAGHPAIDDLQEVEQAAERAVVLTRQLLAFSRKQVLQPVALSLNHCVTRIGNMLRRILGEDIDIEQRLAPDLGLTLTDPGQIEQVLMNLLVNARDAMPDGGKLTVETSNVELDWEYAACHVAVKPGPLRPLDGHRHRVRHGRADQEPALRTLLHHSVAAECSTRECTFSQNPSLLTTWHKRSARCWTAQSPARLPSTLSWAKPTAALLEPRDLAPGTDGALAFCRRLHT
jgi:hypothetical protein